LLDEEPAPVGVAPAPGPGNGSQGAARPQGGNGSRAVAWYFLSGGRMMGPCGISDLAASFRSGALPPDTQVWAQGMKEWFPASALPVFQEVLAQAPPPPAAAAAALGVSGAAQSAGAARPVTQPAAEEFSTEARPWQRWFARIIDLTVAAVVFGAVAEMVAPGSGIFDSNVVSTLVVLAAWMIAEPFVISTFGTTPGKALLNIRLRQADGRMLTFEQAFLRSVRVWLFGMAAGVPLINLIAMASAHGRLRREGTTSWDEAGSLTVAHGVVGPGRVAGIVGFVIFYVLLIVVSVTAGPGAG
jgi:uncharacterized RDD family membrane protein YckC